MALHPETMKYLKPTDEQLATMNLLRESFTGMAAVVEQLVPDGPDKTYAVRKLREVAMWCNVAITRLPDGTPRR
jgi:hypothetical protein